MKSGKKLALLVLLCPLTGVLHMINHIYKTGRISIGLFSLFFIFLAIGLWKHKPVARKIFRFVLWFIFVVTIFCMFLSFYDFHYLFRKNFRGATINELRTIFIFTLIATGAILYYTETDKVLNDFQIKKPVKKTADNLN